MPDKRISELDAAAELDGSEIFPAVQDGNNVQTTLDDMVTYIGANIGGGGTGGDGFNLDCGTASAPASFSFDCGGAS